MKNEEKIYHKIKEASQKIEETTFPGMEKVWNRVEEKLDNTIVKKKSEIWKKLAVAASFLLFFTIGYQLFYTQKAIEETNHPETFQNQSIEPKTETTQEANEIIDQNKIQTNSKGTTTEAVVNKNNNEVSPEEIAADKFYKTTTPVEEIASKNSNDEAFINKDKKVLAPAKSSLVAEKTSDDVKLINQDDAIQMGYLNSASSNSNAFLSNRKIYAARSSNMKYQININEEKKESTTQAENNALVVIDGKLSDKKKENLNEEEYEPLVELNNPIYIINNEEFSEESLFGKKPTSKYAPLSQQKIDSIKVYLPEEAKLIYGEKGKNGVVIITIKN